MSAYKILKGFSRLTDEEKRRIVAEGVDGGEEIEETLLSFRHTDPSVQKILQEFSENTLSNFPLPYGVAPNFLINDRVYMVPMVVEESSVVAAAASAAVFWASRGGFHAVVNGMDKTGQLHFLYTGNKKALLNMEQVMLRFLLDHIRPLTEKMIRRGGGVKEARLLDCTHQIDHYYQLHVRFDTADAMGANFINSVLEEMSAALKHFFRLKDGLSLDELEPLMAILSNYTPGCTVTVTADCVVDALGEVAGLSASDFARRFVMAVRIASVDIYRATTHNKGIMNGVDAVVLATGNDFRAVEAGAHAYASRDGQYRSLSKAEISQGIFRFTLEMPLAIGTLGGLTRLHPLAAASLKILGEPTARELMMIAASAGLANNFAAVRSLITTGIQSGHMRMHLPNILFQLKATAEEASRAEAYFRNKKISHQAVGEFLENLRKNQA